MLKASWEIYGEILGVCVLITTRSRENTLEN